LGARGGDEVRRQGFGVVRELLGERLERRPLLEPQRLVRAELAPRRDRRQGGSVLTERQSHAGQTSFYHSMATLAKIAERSSARSASCTAPFGASIPVGARCSLYVPTIPSKRSACASAAGPEET